MNMYIELTIDVKQQTRPSFDIRLSNQHSIKKLVDIVSQILNEEIQISDGYWIRVQNKQRVYTGNQTLKECGITTGDRVEIL